jgi:hypothetical protein
MPIDTAGALTAEPDAPVTEGHLPKSFFGANKRKPASN